MTPGARSELILIEIERQWRSADRLGIGPGSALFFVQARETLLPLLADDLVDEVISGIETRTPETTAIAFARRWRIARVDRPIFATWPSAPATRPAGRYVLRIRPSHSWWSLSATDRRFMVERLPLAIPTGPQSEVETSLRLRERLVPTRSVALPAGDFLVVETPGLPMGQSA